MPLYNEKIRAELAAEEAEAAGARKKRAPAAAPPPPAPAPAAPATLHRVGACAIETFTGGSGALVYRCPHGGGVVSLLEQALAAAGYEAGTMAEVTADVTPGKVYLSVKSVTLQELFARRKAAAS